MFLDPALIRFAAENGRKDLSFAPGTLNAIAQHSWPGNVRELQNRVQRAVIMADGNRITVTDLELAEARSTTATTQGRKLGPTPA